MTADPDNLKDQFTEYKVASFTGPKAKGNCHQVFVFKDDEALNSSALGALAKAAAPLISVFLFPSPSLTYRVRFFQIAPQAKQGVREILRCGSGSLAAAKVLSDNNQANAISLVTQAGPVMVGCHPRGFFYQTQVLPLEETRAIKSWQQVVNRQVKKVTLVGDGNQYCILELDNQKAVAQAQIHPVRICRISQRALILTAKSDQSSFDYVMRYFAPQYAQIEDAATGSANAMLGPYWQRALGKRLVCGRQLSKPGARFSVEARGLWQRVYGRCERLR